MSWTVHHEIGLKRVTIIPDDDIAEHSNGILCKCSPIIKYDNGIEHIIHNSFDKREYIERLIHDAWRQLN
jgi:hypothetical protein